MKSSKYTQATESIILDNGNDFTVGGSNASDLNIARTFSDGQFQNVNNSEELLLKGSYDEYNRESLFEMQRFNSPERNPARYLIAGQDFELVCNCAPRTRSSQLFNSEQNIVVSTNRSFQHKPDHPENYSQFSLDRKLKKKCQPQQHHLHQPSPGTTAIPFDAGTMISTPHHHGNIPRIQHPEVITLHRAGYESLAHTYIPNHIPKHGEYTYGKELKDLKEFNKGPEEHFGSFRRIKREFGRSSTRSYRGVSSTPGNAAGAGSGSGGGASSGKRRPAADGTDSEPEVDDPELAVFELNEHMTTDCRCACDQLAYSPAYNTCIAEERFPPAPDVTRRLGTPTLSGKPEVTFYRSNSTPGTSNSSSSGSGSSRMDLSSRHWWVVVTVLLLAAAAGVGVPIALRISAGASFEERLEFASRLLHDTPLVDGHNDLPWNIRKFLHNRLKDFKFGEDLRNISPWSQSAWSHTDLPRLKRGHVAAQFWAAYVPCEAQHRDAVQLTLEQIDVIRRLTEQYQPSLTLCTSAADIKSAHENQQMCSLIGVEGGHSLASSLAVLRTLYHVGVRYLTLTSTCNTPWADCSYADMPGRKAEHGGLTSFGKSVVKEMNRLGMIVDLSHVSVGTMRDALDVSKAPVIFSHSSAHALCNSTRNVPDATLRKLALNRGIIMVNFYSHFLTCKDESTVADAVAHINHIREIAGVDNVGLGAGYDGINFTPKGLEDVSSYPTLFAELIGTGKWSPEDLKKLAGLNFLRVFQDVERVRDEFRQAKVPPYEDVITPRPKDNNCSSQDLF